MSKFLPILIVLLGLALGTGAGYMLRPAADPAAPVADGHGDGETDAHDAPDDPHKDAKPDDGHGGDGHGGDGHGGGDGSIYDYVKLNNQFVVPVVRQGAVSAIVVLSLSLETDPGLSETIYTVEPKLRDVFLQVLFDHANTGGFDGNFTATQTLGTLRKNLREAAQAVLGPEVHDVLVLDILRQDTGP